MRAKTIFIVIVTVLVTIILMKNTEPMNFWIFKVVSVPKLAVLGVLFALGFIIGFIARRPRKRSQDQLVQDGDNSTLPEPEEWDEENQNYIT